MATILEAIKANREGYLVKYKNSSGDTPYLKGYKIINQTKFTVAEIEAEWIIEKSQDELDREAYTKWRDDYNDHDHGLLSIDIWLAALKYERERVK